MDWRLELLSLAAVAAAVGHVATRSLIGPLGRWQVVDVPNRRSSHDTPTPRGGGLGLLAGWLTAEVLAELLGYRVLDPIFLIALVLVAGVGWLDDLRGGLPWLPRFGVQVVAAVLVLWRFGPPERLPLPAPADLPLGATGWALGILWIVGVVNLTNFLDGIDGFATGQALLAAAGLAVAGYHLGAPRLLAGALALGGASAGFLLLNWQPARIFLGDVGSASLGLLLAAAPWMAPAEMRTELIFLTAMLMWFFLADGTFTLLRRALRGETLWSAHREHLYQRLVQAGLSHAAVAAGILLLATIPATLATLGVARRSAALEWCSLVAGVASFALLLGYVAKREGAPRPRR